MNRQGNGEGRRREWFSAMNKPGIQYDYLNASCCYFTDIETSSGNFGLYAVNKLPHDHPCSVHASSPFLSLFTSFSSIAIQLYRFPFHFWKTTTAVKITVRNSYGDDNDNHKKKWKRYFWLTFFASTHKRWRQQLLQWLVQLLPWQWWHWKGDLMSLAHRHLTFWNLLMKIRIGKRSNTNIVYSSTNKFIISQNKTSSIIFLETFTVSLPSRC